MIETKKNNIFFDADGVLFASKSFEKSILGVLKKMGISSKKIKKNIYDLEEVMVVPDEWIDTIEKENEMWKILFRQIIAHLEVDNKEIIVQKLLENSVYYKNSYLLKGVEDFLEQYKGEYVYHIITNAYPSVYYILESLGIKKYFKTIISSSDVYMCKPDLEIFRYALKVSGCNAEESFFVDDKEENVKMANSIGMKGIVFDNRKNDLRNLKKKLL